MPLRLRGAARADRRRRSAPARWSRGTSPRTRSAPKASPLAARATAGHQLGALLARDARRARRSPGSRSASRPAAAHRRCVARRRAGALLLALLALAVIAFAGALAAQPPRPHRQHLARGQLAHQPERETAAEHARPADRGGERARALLEGGAAGLRGPSRARRRRAKAIATARLRYRTETLEVRHAHGFVVQTLADLGLVGLADRARAAARLDGRRGTRHASVQPALDALADVARAPRTASVPAGALHGRATRYTPERIGMLSMLCLVVVFGVHSLVDWTWYVPGDACVALLCAGWLAGRGPLRGATRAAAVERRPRPAPATRPTRRARGLAARGCRRAEPLRARVRWPLAVLVAALLAAWAQWQPQRSEDARQQALALLAEQPARGARRGADRRRRAIRCRPKRCSRSRTSSRRAGQPRAGARDARSARCACSRRTRRRGWRSATTTCSGKPRGRAEGAAGRDLPQPAVDRAGSDRRRTPPKRSKSRTTTSRRCEAAQRLEAATRAAAAARAAAVRSASARRARAAAAARRASPPARRTLDRLEAEVLEQRA